MQYFSDGLDGLIRVDTYASRGSREFFFADAERLGSDGAWYKQRNLIVEILNGGYYRPATADEADQIVAVTNAAHIPGPDQLSAPRIPTFISGSTIKYSSFGSETLLPA